MSEETVGIRFNGRTTEIQWRGIQRDAQSVFAILFASGAVVQGGVWAAAAPIILLFIAARWEQHDRRMGSNANYLRDTIEPALGDGIEGHEDFLDRVEANRSYNKPFHFSSVTSRLFFPTLQLGTLSVGMYRLLTTGQPGAARSMLAISAAVVGCVVIVLTFINVTHIRERPPAAPPTP